MALEGIDWVFIIAFFIIALVVGLWVSRRAGQSSSEFFLSGRQMPWWLLGMSMVATTFSTDTPNLVTDIVRQNGVSGNWVWWAFLLTGMLTVFVYAKLWRRSGVMTDIEFYEMRYSGPPAAFLRGFRALYLGIFFNIMIMAAVTLAAIKIGGVLLDLSPLETIALAALVTTIFSMLGGLRGVLLTDFLLFIVAMVGSVADAVAAVGHPDVGGLNGLLSHELVSGKLSILPDFSNAEALVSVLIIPLAVQWWSVWYPGAEPGGGGYIAQRMLSAKDETHATGATLFFNAAHYALRPWPWILVALASLIVFPTVESLQQAFPHISDSILAHDLAYPAMLTFLPHGLLGLVVGSLIAAYMSTISTHLNWGSSYVVNDYWKRFVNREASEKELVLVGRISTVIMMIVAAALALWLENALQAFQILLQIGAGTGLLFILRWFWWRINAFSELTAMVVSFLFAVYVELLHPSLFPDAELAAWFKLLCGVGVTTAAWVSVTFMTRPTDQSVLLSFYARINPGGPGWRHVLERAGAEGDKIEVEKGWSVPLGILCMFAGCVAVYSTLFAIGYLIYGNLLPALVLVAVAVVAVNYLLRVWNRVSRLSKSAERLIDNG
jgi:Na+/proline symporter